MDLKDLRGQKIAFLGLGIENVALLSYLLNHNVTAEYYILDARSKWQLRARRATLKKIADKKGITLHWKTGESYDANLKQFDCIFRIAGYPLFKEPLIEAMMAGTSISSATKIFFHLSPSKNIIGVTGSKGKGTTASLIYYILKNAGKRVHFGGNIGTPLFSFMDKIKPNDWVVLELSSFQTEDLHISPHIAVVTNFYPDHLAAADPANPNYHKTLQSYWQAKAAIFSYQKKDDIVIANEQLRESIEGSKPTGKVRYFTKSELPSGLIGEHNKGNVAAAIQAAKEVGIPIADIKASVKTFKGLPHRLEFIASHKDVRYYNDSFATAPHPATIALQSFRPKSVILIAGGASKASDFRFLANVIKKQAKRVILFPGKGSEEIEIALNHVRYHPIDHASSMHAAIKLARKNAQAGDVVLLSPACASFGLFQNYKERGEKFRREVNKLAGHK